MKPRGAMFLLLLLSTLAVYTQEFSDSLDLVYVSHYEEEVFGDLNKGVQDNYGITDFFFAPDSLYTPKRAQSDIGRVDVFLENIEKKALKYNDRKKVKYIFEQIHDEFFRKYDIEAYFSDIFQSSTYNCVTGSALYCYAFDYFKIPYQIKETPTHVFLVAYPKKYNIYIETTAPGNVGSYVPTDAMIKKAVDNLIELKMILPSEVAEKGYNKVFNEYYYGDENITPIELAGLQYYNKAVSSFNSEKYRMAYENMQKSNVLYGNKRSQLFLEGLLALVVNEIDFKDIENFEWFLKLCHMEEDRGFLRYKLNSILSENEISDVERDVIENKIQVEKFSETLRNDLLEVVYSNRASRFDKLQQRKKAMIYAEKLYELNPDNLDAKNFIAFFTVNSLFQKNLGEERLTDLENLVQKYPFITTFGSYTQYQAFLYSYLVASNFDKDRRTLGLKYLGMLEDLIAKKGKEVNLNQELIGGAYASVGAYFYRKQQKGKSVEYLQKGLKYSPDNESITRKLKLIKNDG